MPKSLTRSETMKRLWAEKDFKGFTGRHHTPEARARVSVISRSRRHTEEALSKMRGRKLTEEHRRKIVELKTGLIPSLETRLKISKAKTGRRLSDEVRKHISEGHKGLGVGESNPMFGKHPSDETRRKLSEAHKGVNTGEKHSNWKGGITPLTQAIRASIKNRHWRTDVFNRDNFTCILCGKRGGYVEADHYPKSFSEIFNGNGIKNITHAFECEEFWDINNGRTLCRKCHDATKKGR